MEQYGKEEYTYYLRNIRTAIEWLCKFVIADMVDGKCKPSDIFSGTKSIRRSGGDFSVQNGKDSPLRGRQLVDVMLLSFLLKRKDVRDNRYDERLKNLREGMEMYGNSLRYLYSIASAANHSSASIANAKGKALKCASTISDFISFLIEEKILKEDNLTELKTLQTIDIVDAREISTLVTHFSGLQAQLDETMLKIENYKKEREELITKSDESNAEKDQRILELEKEIEQMKAAAECQIYSTPPETPASITIPPAIEPDYDQEDIIYAADSESLLVCGCAGSGKSVIAMEKAKRLHEAGADVITIAYTKSLNNYMQAGSRSDIGRFYYHHQWQREGRPTADYVIVDEIQDFTEEEIKEFINAAKKHFYFFGDSAQSIYASFKKGIIDMDRIAELTTLQPMILYTNYRLPRPVAKITQGYVGVNVEPYSERIYKNESSTIPSIVKFQGEADQVMAVADFIEANNGKSIGIFLPDNASVLRFCHQLAKVGISFEFKYEMHKANGNKYGYKPYNTLNFTTLQPKVMTYHSAKGLQFEIVILPWYSGTSSNNEQKALYVAMTRTQSHLIITYSDKLSAPLDRVPEILYKNRLTD